LEIEGNFQLTVDPPSFSDTEICIRNDFTNNFQA